MASEIGYSWQVGADNPEGGPNGQGGSGGRGISPQQAVKILSLRIPERPSPRGIAPQPLLTSKGSAAAGAQGLDLVVAALMQMFKPQTASGAPQVPGAPVSRVPGPDGRPRPDVTPVPPTLDQPLPPVMQPPGLPAPGLQQPPSTIPPPRITPGDAPLPSVVEPEGLPVQTQNAPNPAPWSGPKWDMAFDEMPLSDAPMPRRRGLF